MFIAILLVFYVLFPPEIYDSSFSLFYLSSALFFVALSRTISSIKTSILVILGVFFFLFSIHSFFAQPFNFKYEMLVITYVIYVALLSSKYESVFTTYLVKALIFLVLLTAGYALYQYFYGYTAEYLKLLPFKDDFLAGKMLVYLKNKRVTSTFALPTTYSAFLMMALPFLVLALKASHRFMKITASIAIAGCFTASILTKSYFLIPAFIIFLITFLFAGYVSFKRPLFYLLLFIIMIGASLPFIMRKDISRNIMKSQTIDMRTGNWFVAINMLKDHMLWGVGTGNFHIYYPRYMKGTDIETKYAHNLLLQIGAETGIIGLVVGLYGFFFILIRIIHAYKDKRITLEFWAYSTSTLLFMAYSLIDISFYFPSIGFFGIVCISLFVKEYSHLYPEKSESCKDFTGSMKAVSFLFIMIFIGISVVLHYHGTFLEKAIHEATFQNNEKSLAAVQNYIHYFPYDFTAGALMLSLSTSKPSIEEKMMVYETIKTHFTESARLHYLIASSYMQEQLYFDAYIHYCISPLLYPSRPMYTDACSKSQEMIRNLNERYEPKSP